MIANNPKRSLLSHRLLPLAAALPVLLPPAATAAAGHFSAFRRLGQYYGPFAVNDSGQVVALTSIASGAALVAFKPDGTITAPIPLLLPGAQPPDGSPAAVAAAEARTELGGSTSGERHGGGLVLSDSGWVGVGFTYDDGTSPATGYHNEGCCTRVAAVSWRLGHRPPPLQILSPKLPEVDKADPQVAIGRSAFTVAWNAGGEYGGRPSLYDAFGPLGGGLHVRHFAGAELATPLVAMQSGRPALTWLGESTVNTALISSTGRIERPRRQPAPGGEAEATLVADDEGDTVMGYQRYAGKHQTQFVIVARSPRSTRFTHRRVVATAPRLWSPDLLAGGDRSLTFLWEGKTVNRIFVRRGTVFGRFGRTEVLTDKGGNLRAFTDSRGHTVVVYQSGPPGFQKPWTLMVSTAGPHQPFSPPRRIASFPGECELPEGEEEPIATSPNGHAVIPIPCENRGSYVLFYTP